ncbi:hypothetical protein M427DRAFT_231327 [Gonapodya prolifera JEL478]|uniref:Uncharacterized protein n=1 Tax=Gonapodya prolifera (strain JEL478) TaxID=1344416 RepID=A0A138ZY63_GONPJ|nr:hypothetical protein M427DRAFT_231327 [Gonapodya prolifera JEL478]|eukprot:KXS09430.1 hypothetical protein M427DRAFT_231327 [Gonapodya prolifera JEL478]
MSTSIPLLKADSLIPQGSDKMSGTDENGSTARILTVDRTGETADGSSFTERSVGYIKKLSLALVGKLPGSSDRYTRIGFFLSVLQAVVGVALILSILIFHIKIERWIDEYWAGNNADLKKDDLYRVQSYALALKIYHILFLGTQVFQFYLYIDSIVNSNTMELITLFFFLVISFLYACVNVVQERGLTAELTETFEGFDLGDRYKPHHDLGFAILASNGLFLLLWMIIGSQVYLQMGWLMFRQIGADIKKRRRYIYHHMMLLLLKMDVFFFIGFAVQYFVLVVENPKYALDLGSTVGFGLVAIGGAVLAITVGVMAVRSQSAAQMSVFLLLCVAGFGYLASVMFDLYGKNDLVKQQFTGSREGLAFAEPCSSFCSVSYWVS